VRHPPRPRAVSPLAPERSVFSTEGRSCVSDLSVGYVGEHQVPLASGVAETLGGVIGNVLVSPRRGPEDDMEVVARSLCSCAWTTW
jgi:hypothetical protein